MMEGSKTNIFLDLEINDNNFEFATSIDEAINRTEFERTILNETINSVKNLKPECDRLDYALAVSSGSLCGLVDVFLVGKPGESILGDITDEWVSDKVRLFAKICHPENREFESLESALRFLEKKFNIPYDQTGLGDAGKDVFGLNAKNHHFKSLGHNPSLLGMFFSILDQFTNSSHFITDENLISLENADEKWELKGHNICSKLFCGIVNWIGHLISDVAGSQSSANKGNRGMGIPSPFWTWTNDIIAIKEKLGLSVSESDKYMNDLALNIFERGYDLRFQITQAIPVVINELLVRFIYAMRRMYKYFMKTGMKERSFVSMWKQCEPFSNYTVKRMLAVAHGTFCLIDVADGLARGLKKENFDEGAIEFLLRLNIIGVGKFTISIYGEVKREISYNHACREADYAAKEMIIIDHYMEGLKILSKKYDDSYFLTFIDDFNKSGAYKQGFEKSVQLALLREVPEDKILKSRADIDKYFRGF